MANLDGSLAQRFETSEAMRDLRGYLEPEQVEKVIGAANGNLRDHLFLALLWETGARKGELLELTPQDVDWGHGALVMNILKRKRRKPTDKVPTHIKYLRPQTVDELRQYFQSKPFKPTDKFFDFTGRTAINIVRRYCYAAGIRKIGEKKPHPHHFRHSIAIAMVRNGVSVADIQQFLGHASIGSTTVYLQFAEAEKRGELEAFWKRLRTKKPTPQHKRKTPEESVAKVLESLTPQSL